MKGVYSKAGLSILPNIVIRYGEEPSLRDIYKKILQIDNIEERNEQVDNLIELLELDRASSGFLGKDDVVDCGCGRGFLLDDREIYYQFFTFLNNLNRQNSASKLTDGAIVNRAIKATIVSYFGNGVNRQLRFQCTSLVANDHGDDVFPSISLQKGKNCSYCTEKAAVSHNLWLMTGATSYFCWTNCDNLGANEEDYKNDTHNFTIVKYDDKFRLYDVSMDNYCMLNNDCIDNLLSGKGLEVKDVKNPGVYATNDVINLDSKVSL